jgi:hypothetical protein
MTHPAPRLREDVADTGFLSRSRSDEVSLIAAEFKSAAWDVRGHKL